MVSGRSLLFVLDSLGIGGAPDAVHYRNNGVPDTGANTLLHIAQACARGECDGRREYGQPSRRGPLWVPNLNRLGIGGALHQACGEMPIGLTLPPKTAEFAALCETSRGKDTPSGHYELCGVPGDWDGGYVPRISPCFPEPLIAELVAKCKLPGVLGQKHASGTEILVQLGEEHCKTGKPIVYTSADSVFQIAAHEATFGLKKLYDVCETARQLCDPLNIGRVIARPFIGGDRENFSRTGNRKDYAVAPPGFNLLDAFVQEGRSVWAVGKISDIFAHRSITHAMKASGLSELVNTTLNAMGNAKDGDLIVANFVDFDSHYGHRRDIPGYASALEYWDSRLPELLEAMKPDDQLVITADHGNDPSWIGTDHTREQVPMLAIRVPAKTCSKFSDVARSIAVAAKLEWRPTA